MYLGRNNKHHIIEFGIKFGEKKKEIRACTSNIFLASNNFHYSILL